MTRPVIGIAAYRERARWNMWDTDAVVVHQYYVHNVTAAGGRAVVLPPDDTDTDVLSRLDGLVLTGGADIDARLFGQRPHPEAEPPHALRDRAELLLLRAALDADLPVLGICRGLQLLALAYGGSLHQHLPDVVGHDGHSPASGEFATHEVTFTEGSRARGIYGPRAVLNSHHHQAVAETGPGLVATGHAPDGVVEAAEDPGRRFVMGVQWHPEMSDDTALFGAFVSACAGTAAALRG
ncbi:gamma-glutamyl-gamma-aminobutyrate hydrolase family protein [Lentzea sp. NPDC060358]|uniref:gamma-glutamyl-gamma-aminobutyrate hydrolase family protein n=1 Tax=Lentzea sp. NPDC060358 TaxID=3347103 RepID=UPI0036632F9B